MAASKKQEIFEIPEPFKSIISGIVSGWEGMEHIPVDCNVSIVSKNRVN